ncbi:MAG: peptide ABC transporter substrate-binding protein [Candidatus Kerfeldbacteria bacterium]|nr:peptide ABC transporter substrate-binding protein [Candidatus Kerfeldbacteria bacterium]
MFPKVLDTKERKVGFILLITCLITGSWLAWRWHQTTTVIMPQVGGEYSEALIGKPQTANPLLATADAEFDLSQLTYRGLFKYSKEGKAVPDLAESWQLSADGKTYQITLRPDLKWSDGNPLTSYDVAFTFNSLQNSQLNSPRATEFKEVAVKRIDQRRLNFTLKNPYTPFLGALTIGLIPAHIWEVIPPEKWLSSEAGLKTVGTGPFRFKDLITGQQGIIKTYILEPNPYTHTHKPFLQQITLKFLPDLASALDSLKQGMVQGLGGLDGDSASSLSSQKFSLYDIPLPQYTAIFFNPEQNEFLKNESLRRALSYATNRLDLIQELAGNNYRPATGPFVVGELKNKTANLAWPFNLESAQKIINEAGYSKNKDNQFFTNKQGQPLAITLTTVDQNQYLAVAEQIQKQWSRAGFKVELNVVPTNELQNSIINNRAYQALLASEIIGLDPDPYPFWHSSQAAAPGLNLALFQNHEADTLLTSARQSRDDKQRQAQYLRFQEILKDDSPAVFLFSKNYIYALSHSLRGVERRLINQPANRFLDIENWYTKIIRE